MDIINDLGEVMEPSIPLCLQVTSNLGSKESWAATQTGQDRLNERTWRSHTKVSSDKWKVLPWVGEPLQGGRYSIWEPKFKKDPNKRMRSGKTTMLVKVGVPALQREAVGRGLAPPGERTVSGTQQQPSMPVGKRVEEMELGPSQQCMAVQ